MENNTCLKNIKKRDVRAGKKKWVITPPEANELK